MKTKKIYIVEVAELVREDNYIDSFTEVYEDEETAKQRVDKIVRKKEQGEDEIDSIRVLSGVYGKVIYFTNDNICKVKMRETWLQSAPSWGDKLKAIVEAAKTDGFSDEINDIEILSYKEYDSEKQKEKIWEDRFDYIDTTTFPISIRFIGGTGYDNLSCSIGNLTEESINRLYECVL